jgi:hypothetical protein
LIARPVRRDSRDKLVAGSLSICQAATSFGGLHLRSVRHGGFMHRSLVSRSNHRNAPLPSDFKSALTPPAFSTPSSGALGVAAIASSRSPWRSCGGLLARQVLDLTRWRVLRIALRRPW